MNSKKGFVLLETIIVMTVLSIALLMLYATYVKVLSSSTKVNYYDNVDDLYTAYYLYKFSKRFGYNGENKIVLNITNQELLKNLNISKVYFFSKDYDVFDNLIEFDGSTINYLNSVENDLRIDECVSDPCLTIVKIIKNGKIYFAKYENYIDDLD